MHMFTLKILDMIAKMITTTWKNVTIDISYKSVFLG